MVSLCCLQWLYKWGRYIWCLTCVSSLVIRSPVCLAHFSVHILFRKSQASIRSKSSPWTDSVTHGAWCEMILFRGIYVEWHKISLLWFKWESVKKKGRETEYFITRPKYSREEVTAMSKIISSLRLFHGDDGAMTSHNYITSVPKKRDWFEKRAQTNRCYSNLMPIVRNWVMSL